MPTDISDSLPENLLLINNKEEASTAISWIRLHLVQDKQFELHSQVPLCPAHDVLAASSSTAEVVNCAPKMYSSPILEAAEEPAPEATKLESNEVSVQLPTFHEFMLLGNSDDDKKTSFAVNAAINKSPQSSESEDGNLNLQLGDEKVKPVEKHRLASAQIDVVSSTSLAHESGPSQFIVKLFQGQQKVIVYGHCLEAYACINGLLHIGIDGQRIVLVQPPLN
ncbi:unnamed protein product [Protopolystoma xenopodis]|uniref:Uncharacterized protein n=1 Tax=Protopolystoma xenopodis TaxID=117903 RepID=A0A448WD06_9PLAT|nr:unnamed protein product [Protopolystoma xenopodis]